MMEYRSSVVRVGKVVLAAPMYVLGGWREEEVLKVVVGEGAGGREGWVGVDRGVDVYEAWLKCEVRLDGVGWWMVRWRVVVGVVAVGGFWGVSVGVAVGVWWAVGRGLERWGRERGGRGEVVGGEEEGILGVEEEVVVGEGGRRGVGRLLTPDTEWESSGGETEREVDVEAWVRESAIGGVGETGGTGRAVEGEVRRRRRS